MSNASRPSTGIWTPESRRSFHQNIEALSGKLGQFSPRVPENYRSRRRQTSGSEDYILSYEEELHLADHFAFLAHVEEGVEFVSAVSLEESQNPPSLTVRLASNHTPTVEVKRGLGNILEILQEHAGEGRHREKYMSRLFDEVVCFSQKRIHGRLRSSHWVRPRYMGQSVSKPLYERIERTLSRLEGSPRHLKRVPELRAALLNLANALKRVDRESSSDLGGLQDAIRQSYKVSNLGTFKSLESNLMSLGLGERVAQSRTVLEIDKLSKYLSICEDFIRLSRQPRTRALCQNLKLETCTSYKGSRPEGSQKTCFVHGEVQLVLFYERNPRRPPPRAIGSSKSACFLCDRLVKYHGSFGVSHSHMHLFPQWTIPESPWMNTQQAQRFRNIIRDVNDEVLSLLDQNSIYKHSAVIQSRALLLFVESSSIASSVVSSKIPQTNVKADSAIEIPRMSPPSLLEAPRSTASERTLFYFQDLPITINILPSTLSCTLLSGKVDYIFDLEAVDTGELLISEATAGGTENLQLDVQQLSPSTLVHMKSEGTPRSLSIIIHDSDSYRLRMTFTWLDKGP